MKVKVYNASGQTVGERELPAALFGVPVKPGLLQLAVVAQQANARQVLAHTKTRGEVRGGGRKPWRQKGTGRARHGSIRSPIWIGGGITFGPRSNRNFTLKMNRKVRRQALRMALSSKAEAVYLVDDIKPLGGKTKTAFQLLTALKLRPGKAVKPAVAEAKKKAAAVPAAKSWPRVLVVLPPKSDDQVLAFRNLRRVSAIAADSLNVADVLSHQVLMLPLAGLDRMMEVYGATTKS
ncbi:MAG: 50S ribosomal protein L4 [bacterium]|nr:50S ribosomal protein L4 [bacterium]